jgi:hypothetical protein
MPAQDAGVILDQAGNSNCSVTENHRTLWLRKSVQTGLAAARGQ